MKLEDFIETPPKNFNFVKTILRIELKPLQEGQVLFNEDVAVAVAIAKAEKVPMDKYARSKHFELESMIEHQPPYLMYDDTDRKKAIEIRALANKALRKLLKNTRTKPLADVLLAIMMPPPYTDRRENIIRTEKQKEFQDILYHKSLNSVEADAYAKELAAVAQLRAMPADGHARRLVWAVLNAPRSPAPFVYVFNAFRGARAMPEVEAALAAELKDVGPLRVAKGAQLTWLPPIEKGDVPVTSLSACGVLCAGGHINDNPLAVAHLPTRRAVAIVCEEEVAHGFVHDGELFVAQEGRDTLWHAPVTEVLAGRTDLADFEQMPLAAKWGGSACLDAAPAGWVMTVNKDNSKQHMVVDLAARTSRLFDVGPGLTELCGFNGVDMQIGSWGAIGLPAPLFMIRSDGTIVGKIAEAGECPTVLPSASRPADWARAAVFSYDGTFSVGGVCGELQRPVRPHSQSLVRLHRDVFLCWDVITKAWVTVRIVVP